VWLEASEAGDGPRLKRLAPTVRRITRRCPRCAGNCLTIRLLRSTVSPLRDLSSYPSAIRALSVQHYRLLYPLAYVISACLSESHLSLNIEGEKKKVTSLPL
jgi:hypothetical protein